MTSELERILERVGKLYTRYGIRSITMNDISKELGISKKTLYQHIHDKTELVAKVVFHVIQNKQQRIGQIIQKPANAIDQLFELVAEVNTIIKEYNPVMENDLNKFYPEIYQKILAKRQDYMFKTILKNIKKGKKEGIYRKNLNEKIIARLHLSRIEQIPEDKVLSIEEYVSPKSFIEIFEYHVRGIANAKGIEILQKKLKSLDKQFINV